MPEIGRSPAAPARRPRSRRRAAERRLPRQPRRRRVAPRRPTRARPDPRREGAPAATQRRIAGNRRAGSLRSAGLPGATDCGVKGAVSGRRRRGAEIAERIQPQLLSTARRAMALPPPRPKNDLFRFARQARPTVLHHGSICESSVPAMRREPNARPLASQGLRDRGAARDIGEGSQLGVNRAAPPRNSRLPPGPRNEGR